jgi:hypothetical protein
VISDRLEDDRKCIPFLYGVGQHTSSVYSIVNVNVNESLRRLYKTRLTDVGLYDVELTSTVRSRGVRERERLLFI